MTSFSVAFDRALALALVGYRSAVSQERKLQLDKPTTEPSARFHHLALRSAVMDRDAAASALANMVHLVAPHFRGDGCELDAEMPAALRAAHARQLPEPESLVTHLAETDSDSTRAITAAELEAALSGKVCEFCGQTLPEGAAR